MSGNREEIKELKIAFVTENQFTGKINPLFTNRRVEFEWMLGLDVTHFHWSQIKINPKLLKDFGVTIFILPKTRPQEIETIRLTKGITKQIIMQEGPCYYWQDYSVQIQIEYYKMLQEVDAVFCHNEYDKNYYEGLTNKSVFILPTMINLAFVSNLPKAKSKIVGSVFINGNNCSWYNASSGLAVVKDIPEVNTIVFPSMGRKQKNEEILMSTITDKEIKYIPYSDWSKFMTTLSFCECGINMMPTIAAGTFSKDCAALGIPCIGNKYLDTQRICFPDLCVEPYDIKKARELMEQLISDEEFYNMVCHKALVNVEKFSTSLVCLEVKKNLLGIVNNGIKE